MAAPLLMHGRYREHEVEAAAAALARCWPPHAGSTVWPSGWLRITAVQLARGRGPLPQSGPIQAYIVLPLVVLPYGPICWFGRAIPQIARTILSTHPTKQPYPPTASTIWLESNYESLLLIIGCEFVFCRIKSRYNAWHIH
uniref:Uncharacterized protein n=1 Tax=Oryza punctata TaxID=4537 RepID=A0A0E0M1L6_ORYPU